MTAREYYVYIMTNATRTLYVGVTNNLERRVYEHKNKSVKGFTAQYNVNWLVYYASTPDVRAAIEREKQIKGWTRTKKLALVSEFNPDWRDLSLAWYDGANAKVTVEEPEQYNETCGVQSP